ncbi:MAG: hypothetical protein JWO92_2492 [Chitinophagaceae bacterium]|nr:hypothetical protein [Chitinophagaceae bacterium]
METYAIFCNEVGRKFSFNAKDKSEAISKMREWCRYHSHSSYDYNVKRVPENDNHDLHNEYFD